LGPFTSRHKPKMPQSLQVTGGANFIICSAWN
jgi:hypothetical protein